MFRIGTNWLTRHGATCGGAGRTGVRRAERSAGRSGCDRDVLQRIAADDCQPDVSSRDDARDAVAAAARLAEQRLGMSPSRGLLECLCGATNSLDPYSAYLTPDQLNDVYAQIEGNFVGLGVELKAKDGGLTIVRVISGSPAEEAGIRAGDRILVDRRPSDRKALHRSGRQPAARPPRAASSRSAGRGGPVASAVERPPPRRRGAQRRSGGIIDPQYGVGYFKLTCFEKTTARDLDAALWKLHRQGMKSLVVDVRGNPGGLLVSAVEVVDRFVDRGIIVSTRGRIAQEDYTYSAHEQGKWRMPLVVIIDQDSASAAEIFAGAIRDHHRGTLVGVRSFGKGSVQGIFPLDESNAGMRLTTAKFYSPNGHPYAGSASSPTFACRAARPLVAKPIDGQLPAADDPMLDRALRIARGAGAPLQAAQQ